MPFRVTFATSSNQSVSSSSKLPKPRTNNSMQPVRVATTTKQRGALQIRAAVNASNSQLRTVSRARKTLQPQQRGRKTLHRLQTLARSAERLDAGSSTMHRRATMRLAPWPRSMARGPSAIAGPTEFCGCMFTMEMKVFCNSTQEQANMQQPAATDLMSRDDEHCTERKLQTATQSQ